MKRSAILIAVAVLLSPIGPSAAQRIDTIGYAEIVKMPVPVIDGDITDRPYRVIGVVQATVRRATVFSKNPSREKVYKELWERARKLKADAVVNAKYGEARPTAWSYGARDAEGEAIKFLTDEEIAARSGSPAGK